MHRLPPILFVSFLSVGFVLHAACGQAPLPGFQTNTAKRSIDLDELQAGGPPKDGIPAIDDPGFVSVAAAESWLAPQEPVIALVLEGRTRAYPLQILTWHEIVNDVVGGVPVAVTFCPLCYSAIVYHRTLGGTTYTFGVSGLLRYSDLVMYDRQTETLWQQFNGEAIVGDLMGATLTTLPAQIIAFQQFAAAYPAGEVLSRDTGYERSYGINPYKGYDNVDNRPFLFEGPADDRLLPMEKVVAVSHNGVHKAYPYAVTRKEHVVHDTVAGTPIVVFHAEGAVSALDATAIAASREVGATGVFDARVQGTVLRFRYEQGVFVDERTGSVWDITGQAVEGPLAGMRLQRLVHGDYFAFAWFAFRPETQVVQTP
jgi:hypothetical protein